MSIIDNFIQKLGIKPIVTETPISNIDAWNAKISQRSGDTFNPTRINEKPFQPTGVSKETPDSSSVFSPLNSTSSNNENSRIVKASAGTLYSILGYNAKTSSQFIQIFNNASLPPNGTVPVIVFKVPASSNFNLSSDKFGRYFSSGITICNSSTEATKTIGSNDCWFDVEYI